MPDAVAFAPNRAASDAGAHRPSGTSFGEAPQPLGDTRFRALLCAADWARLPAAIRRRFSKRVAAGASTVYRGRVVETRMSAAGRVMAQVARLVGGPLPISRDVGLPAIVTVTEDVAGAGQHWTRLYARRRGFPHIIHSSKRFAGPTGLEEYIGCGLGMALRVHVEAETLVFRSAGYFVECGPLRAALPRWLWPGSLTVTHRDLGGGRFVFALSLEHPRLGALIEQIAFFEETRS